MEILETTEIDRINEIVWAGGSGNTEIEMDLAVVVVIGARECRFPSIFCNLR